MCGDINGDLVSADIVDLSYLVEYIFGTGQAPVPLQAGSLNCDEFVDVVDLSTLVDYLFGPNATLCCF